jgi:hypothetical protein
MSEEKLEQFKKYASTMEEVVGVYLIKSSKDQDLWGFMIVEDECEKLDKHCEKCMKEISYFKFAPHDQIQYQYLLCTVSPTKFSKIKSGELKPEHFYLCERLT